MEKPVAFFDIDGTLFRSSLLVELCDRLIHAEVFPIEATHVYEDEYRAWQNRTGTYEAYITAVIESFRTHIRGVHYGIFADIGREVVSDSGKRVYRYTRDRIATLKKDGYFLVAVSQSPKTILDEFCASYGFDKVYGRMYELGPQDRFTGVVTDEHLIGNKANIVNRVFEKEQVTRIGSVGVGDTESDIALLEAIEKPLCFNPNMPLYRHAKLQGWPIVVERKDVIYEL